METTVKQRLIEFIEHKNLSKKKFEETVGLSNGYVNNLKSQPRDEIIKKILLSFPDLNRVWLLTGEGKMLTGVQEVVPLAPGKVEEYTTTKAGITYYKREDGQLLMKVPIVPISALGSPADEYQQILEEFNGELVTIEVGEIHHGSYIAFRIEGDSMDDGTWNGFRKGDTVVVRELSRDKWLPKLHIKDWPYWVVVFGNCVRIKQIIAQDDETGAITLHSLNPSPEFTDFTLQLDEVSRLFNVVQHVPKPRKF
jgi:hypothetical protein